MSGNDILLGGLGADTLNGGAGSRDAADYQSATQGVGVNLQTGGFDGEADGDSYSGIEYVYGSEFDDDITGDDGVNRLVGNDGNDTFDGAAGNDYILGGAGNDTMTGGAGNDVFQMAEGFGNDVITDFEAGLGRTDRIWFRGMNESWNDLTFTDTVDGAEVMLSDGSSLLLENVLVSDLVQDDFIF